MGQEEALTSEKDYEYDVAISYASEDSSYVEALATVLCNLGVRVFYDKYEKASLWGKNLYEHLSDLYQNKARYCVIFLSRHYAHKVWTKHELKAAQARALSENYEYILPIRLDDTDIPGILPTVAYLNWYQESAQTIADILKKKLNKEPRLRPSVTAHQTKHEKNSLISSPPSIVDPPQSPSPAMPLRRSRTVLFVLVLMLIMTGSFGVYWLWNLNSFHGQSTPHPVDPYPNYGEPAVGHAMCRGNPGNPLSMPGGTISQTFTVPVGVSSLSSALVQIDPDSSVTAHLSIAVNGTTVAPPIAATVGDTRFRFQPITVSPGDAITLTISFTATSGKIITVYTTGHPGGTFSASNQCPDGAPNVQTTSTGLRAVVSGMS